MTIQQVQIKIDEIVKAKNIKEKEIYNTLLEFLETTYSNGDTTNGEEIILNNIKIKILTRLYSKEGHRHNISQRTKYNQLFDLNRIEMNLFEKAFNDLVEDGQIAKFMYCISLTEKGITNAKNL